MVDFSYWHSDCPSRVTKCSILLFWSSFNHRHGGIYPLSIHPFVHLGSVESIARLQQILPIASKFSDKTGLKIELKKTASRKGFRIVDNDGSGNCLFYALSDQLEIAMGIKLKHDELRQRLVQYLRKNPKLVS